MRLEGNRLFTLLAVVLLLFAVLAGGALVAFVRASSYGHRVGEIRGIGDMMPELFRE